MVTCKRQSSKDEVVLIPHSQDQCECEEYKKLGRKPMVDMILFFLLTVYLERQHARRVAAESPSRNAKINLVDARDQNLGGRNKVQ